MPWPKGKPAYPQATHKRIATQLITGGKRKRSRVGAAGQTEWCCSTCSEWKTADLFYEAKRSPNGLKAQCKVCHLEGSIRTRDYENCLRLNRESEFRARSAGRRLDKPRLRDPTKLQARYILNAAVRAGTITRPDQCSRCHGASSRIEGHHADYSKPLDVAWLCSGCHGKAHRHGNLCAVTP